MEAALKPKWLVPSDSSALREVSNLTLSEILDRQIDLEKVIALENSEEATRAKVLLRATYTELQKRYRK